MSYHAVAATKVARAFQPVKIVRQLVSAFTGRKARATSKSSRTIQIEISQGAEPRLKGK
jgi:hypothetical protein